MSVEEYMEKLVEIRLEYERAVYHLAVELSESLASTPTGRRQVVQEIVRPEFSIDPKDYE